METALRGEEEKVTEIKRYTKKPVTIEAVQWTGRNISDICKFTDRDIGHLLSSGQLFIETLEGYHHAEVGDYIIKGVKGEFYPCKPDVFSLTYAPEQEPATWVRYSTSMMACSRCGRHTARHRFEYCPHCGAPMRERKEE